MELFFAGNFPALNTLTIERANKDFVESKGLEYKRLVSFFYPKHVQNILDLKEEKCLNCKHSNGEPFCNIVQSPHTTEISEAFWCPKWEKQDASALGE